MDINAIIDQMVEKRLTKGFEEGETSQKENLTNEIEFLILGEAAQQVAPGKETEVKFKQMCLQIFKVLDQFKAKDERVKSRLDFIKSALIKFEKDHFTA